MTHITPPKDVVLIDVPMPIETPRLTIRPLAPGDGTGMTEAKTETWSDLTKWMDWTAKGNDPIDTEIAIRKEMAKFILRENIWLVGIERETAKPVIWTGLHRFSWETRSFEIGYWVRKSAHNKGYATESTHALIRYAFGALAAKRVEISHAAGNEASKRVIDKLGFTYEGTARNATLLPDGRHVDSLRYARLDANGLPAMAVKWGP